MLSFVSLISHDYSYLIESIKTYYDVADEIILGMDRDNISWSNISMDIPTSAIEEIKSIDVDNKIEIIQQDFHSKPTPMENETYQRNVLSMLCKNDNWIVQVDADECIIDSKELQEAIETSDKNKMVQCAWISLFKHIKGSTYLRIERYDELFPIATKLRGQYISGRYTSQEFHNLNIEVIHYSWGRSSEKQVYDKLKNFGHSKDFDIEFWFNLWRSIDESNYSNYYNFHPLNPPFWPSLKKIDIEIYKKRDYTYQRHGAWDIAEAEKSHLFDEGLANAIVNLYPTPPKSTADLGCGKGFYCKKFSENNWSNVYGFEGTPNVWGVFDFIIHMDLSVKHKFPKYELVISLEVGEHIPAKYEDNFIYNITQSTDRFLIISWAVPGQGGIGHFNEQPQEYIIDKITKNGLELNYELTNQLRQSSNLPWFKNTLLFFERKK